MLSEEKLYEMLKFYKHKQHQHSVGSNHYWRYSGKIEAIKDVLEELDKAKNNLR